MGTWPNPDHDGWEGYMGMERVRLAARIWGRMAPALGSPVPGESQEDLDRIAEDDRP
jgi:hypothetical protein